MKAFRVINSCWDTRFLQLCGQLVPFIGTNCVLRVDVRVAWLDIGCLTTLFQKRKERRRSASKFFLPQSLFFAFSSSNNRATKQVLQTHFKSEQKEAKRDLTYSGVENQQNEKEKFKKGHIFTNPKFFK
mgnify:CR=1 FL=1